MQLRTIEQIELRDKRVFIRSDLNVPIENGVISNDVRIRASIPTIEYCLKEQAKVIICSHFGRPKVGKWDKKFSLQPVAQRLSELLQVDVPLIHSIEESISLESGQALLLENIRFEEGETKDDPALAQRLAKYIDAYCLDAFGTSHRAHVSTHGLVKHVETASAGLLLSSEIDALSKAMEDPKKPLVAIIGGAKVSGKLEVLHNLANIANTLIVGGGMANTFLLANGHEIGNSISEPDLVADARKILDKVKVALPTDVMVTRNLNPDGESILRLLDDVREDEIIADIGPVSARSHADLIKQAGTILWNGPMGVFEITQFGEGTRVVAEAIANSQGFSVAGGGDTVAAIDRYMLTDQIDYISTGGGAFLEFIEGRKLPGIAALEQSM